MAIDTLIYYRMRKAWDQWLCGLRGHDEDIYITRTKTVCLRCAGNTKTVETPKPQYETPACNCRYASDPTTGVPEALLDYAKYFPGTGKPCVAVDRCIADVIEQLWAAGVRTGACCCGHNGTRGLGRPNVMITDPAQAKTAYEVLSNDPRNWWVIFWAGANQGLETPTPSKVKDPEPEQLKLTGIEDADGYWYSCSGCHHTNEGYETGDYPYSETLRCMLGAGCGECGGLGARWDDGDYSSMIPTTETPGDPE